MMPQCASISCSSGSSRDLLTEILQDRSVRQNSALPASKSSAYTAVYPSGSHSRTAQGWNLPSGDRDLHPHSLYTRVLYSPERESYQKIQTSCTYYISSTLYTSLLFSVLLTKESALADRLTPLLRLSMICSLLCSSVRFR